jgi:N-methylhydantoinase A
VSPRSEVAAWPPAATTESEAASQARPSPGDDPGRFRLGVDIGGTFTDAVLVDGQSGQTTVAKLPTTPDDPSIGFMHVVRRITRDAAIEPGAIGVVVHGTTVATNAIIAGQIARTAFVTTAGFRDMLEIGRQIRPSLYDLQFEKPVPLVPRYRCVEVVERLGATGEILVPLDPASVVEAVRALRDLDVEAVAICLLHSYINPEHEEQLASSIRAELPGVVVSASSEIAPEFREYFRASTTVVNAAVAPVVERYLGRVAGHLAADGYRAALLVMQSGGGVMPFHLAQRRPVFMIESGPAAGVVAAAHLAEQLGVGDVISFDMGGTTAKVGLVRGGVPAITKDFEVGATAMPGVGGVARGSGYPIRTPVIELVEIGAGGGSVAWVDAGGALRVGPRSVGAEPGPACYGKGGIEPTVSDANLILGRLNPDRFLGGEMTLEPALAVATVEARCGRVLGLDTIAAAHSIVEIANVAMANAMRLVSVQRGFDPRLYSLVAFGGAGPLHANRLAEMLGIERLVIPRAPGAFSASGLISTDLRFDLVRTLRARMEGLSADHLSAAFDELTQRGISELNRDAPPGAEFDVLRVAEMHYVGQSHELEVPIAAGSIADETLVRLAADFHQRHEQAYGYRVEGEPVMVVNIRVAVIARRPRTHEPQMPKRARSRRARRAARRPVWFAETGGFTPTGVHLRTGLEPGDVIDGPAVVEQHDSTCVVHPGYVARVGTLGELHIGRVPGSRPRIEVSDAPSD